MNRFNIPVVNYYSGYDHLPRIIWLNLGGNIRSRWENDANGFFIQFGIQLNKYKR